MELKFSASLHASALAAALILAGCVSPEPEAEVDFTKLTINQKPASLIMDTGSDSSLIFQTSHVGLTMAVAAHDWPVNGEAMEGFGLSSPANISFGGQALTAPLPVMQDPPWYFRWLFAALMGSDGLISWSEVKDNILVFDSARQVVRAVPELPPETAGWLQLKVRRSGPLTLEIPLPDGTTGTVLVDTGQPYGVSLAPKPWRDWNAAHPQAPSATRMYSMIGADLEDVKEAWADAISLGPLTITDVPVHQALDVEWAGDAFHYAGTLGMYALTRVDLIVDGKNGVAYLHPKPPPGLQYPGIKRANEPANLAEGDSKWTVDPSVQMVADNFWVDSASVKLNVKDYDGALADVNRALGINPNNPAAHDALSDVKLAQGDTDGALAEDDRAVAIDPQPAGFYDDRGFVKFMRGDGDAALADYNQSLAIDPQDANAYVNRGDAKQGEGGFLDALNDYYLAGEWQPGGWPDTGYAFLHGELLRRQLGLPPVDVAGTIADWNDGWVKSIGQFMSGNLSEAALLAAANKDDTGAPGNAATVREQHCEAEYYLGMMRLLQGDVAAAREHWQKCAANPVLNVSEYIEARAELALTDQTAPNPSEAQLLFLASKKYTAGDFAGASSDFTQAIAVDSSHAYAYYYRGLCRFGQGDYAGAEADLTQAIALDPKNFLAYENRGVVKESLGDHSGAVADYTQAFTLDPHNATIDADDELALECKGDYAGAIAFHTKEMDSDAKERLAYDYGCRGEVKQMQGDFAGALADYNQAIDRDPGGAPYTHVLRQFLQLRLGQTPTDFSKELLKWKDDWTKALGQFALGKLSEEALLAEVWKNDASVTPILLCEADYCIGYGHLIKGDTTGARSYWQKCLATNQLNEYCYLHARAELARLDATPKN